MPERRQVAIGRMATATLGALAVGIALLVKSLNVAFLVGLAFSLAASANLPVILLSLFWRRFNDAGAIAGVVAGTVTSVGLVLVGPAVMGPNGLLATSLKPLFPLANPGIVSIPCGFAAAWLVALLTDRNAGRHSRDAEFEAQQLRMLSGYGAEQASQH